MVVDDVPWTQLLGGGAALEIGGRLHADSDVDVVVQSPRCVERHQDLSLLSGDLHVHRVMSN